MSKRSLFWGHGSGKLGEAVFYRAGGEQRTRAYTAIVKNPRTYAQALQRTKLNNMVGAYKDLKKVVEAFVKPVKASQSPFNAFFAENWKRNRWVASPEELGNREGVSSGFVVSNGKLAINTECTPMEVTLSASSGGAKKWGFHLGLPLPVTTSLASKDDTNGIVVNSGRALYEVLTANGNPFNLPSDFWVTIIESWTGVSSVTSYVYMLRCNADNVNGFTCVSYPFGADAPSLADLDRLVTLVGGTIGEVNKVEGATGLVFGSLFDDELSMENGIALVISYSGADGFQHTQSFLKYSKGLHEAGNQFLPSTEIGRDIINQYQSGVAKLGRTDKPYESGSGSEGDI